MEVQLTIEQVLQLTSAVRERDLADSALGEATRRLQTAQTVFNSVIVSLGLNPEKNFSISPSGLVRQED